MDRDFALLQSRLPRLVHNEARTRPLAVLVVPSFFDSSILATWPMLAYWEHRMLHVLGRLRNPLVRVVYVATHPFSSAAIRYYATMVPAIASDWEGRFHVLGCGGITARPLADRLLADLHLLGRIRAEIGEDDAYLECFQSTEAEKRLALTLGIPVNAPDPAVAAIGSKSRGRELFEELGVPTPPGIGDIEGWDALVAALAELKARVPSMRRAVVKLDDSAGGLGNVAFSYDGCPAYGRRDGWVAEALAARLAPAPGNRESNRLLEQLASSRCVVEQLIEGAGKRSPSVQCRLSPTGELQVRSTHEQHFTPGDEFHFAACSLPARNPGWLHEAVHTIGQRLHDHGAIGEFGVDFVTVEGGKAPEHFAIEVNLRHVGTEHHLALLQNLTGGGYDEAKGRYVTGRGEARYYYGSDTFKLPTLVGLPAEDLVRAFSALPGSFDPATQAGTALHMVDAAQPHGRLGVTCIGRTPAESYAVYTEAVQRLHQVGQLSR